MYNWKCPSCNAKMQTYKNTIPPAVKWVDHECMWIQDPDQDIQERMVCAIENFSNSFNPSFSGSFAERQIMATEQISGKLIDIENRIFGEAYSGSYNTPLVEKLEAKNATLETRMAELEKSIFLLRNGGNDENG